MGMRAKKRIHQRIIGVCVFAIVIAVLYAVIIDSSQASLASALDFSTEESAAGGRLIKAPSDTSLTVEIGPATIVLDPNSELLLEEALEPGRSEVSLMRGKLSANVRPMKSHEFFAVRTFNAVAGVRGTLFTVSILENIRTLIEVQHGSVFAQGISGERVIIEAGQKAAIEGLADAEKIELPKPPDIAKMMEEMQAMAVAPPIQDDAKIGATNTPRVSEKAQPVDWGQTSYNPTNWDQNGATALSFQTTDIPTISISPISIDPVNYSANP